MVAKNSSPAPDAKSDAERIEEFRSTCANTSDLMLSDEEILERLRTPASPKPSAASPQKVSTRPSAASVPAASSNKPEPKAAPPAPLYVPRESIESVRRLLARSSFSRAEQDEILEKVGLRADPHAPPLPTPRPPEWEVHKYEWADLRYADPDSEGVRQELFKFEKMLSMSTAFPHIEGFSGYLERAATLTAAQERIACFCDYSESDICRVLSLGAGNGQHSYVRDKILSYLKQGLTFQQIWDRSLPIDYSSAYQSALAAMSDSDDFADEYHPEDDCRYGDNSY